MDIAVIYNCVMVLSCIAVVGLLYEMIRMVAPDTGDAIADAARMIFLTIIAMVIITSLIIIFFPVALFLSVYRGIKDIFFPAKADK